MVAKRLTSALALLLLILAPSGAVGQQPDSVVMDRGRELTRMFYDGRMDSIAAALDDQMRGAIGGPAGLRAFREQIAQQLGSESAVIGERVVASGIHRVYTRSARFEKIGTPIAIVWALDAAGLVAGFQIRPEQGPSEAAPSPYLDYEPRTELRLPFDDEWTVVWGGRTIEQNYHAAYADQRFAYDMLVTRDDSSHRGDGTSNEDYYCFGLPILAPAAGTIVVASDGLADNTPGQFTSDTPPGNHVVIDHGSNEYSFLAHLRLNSVRVSPGDRVAAGDEVGQCGNSGRSSEPHLHYHLQNTPEFGRGEGLPPKFVRYIAGDQVIERGEPVQGERIRPAGR